MNGNCHPWRYITRGRQATVIYENLLGNSLVVDWLDASFGQHKYHQPDILIMTKIASCPCGWTVISPQGEEEAAKHSRIHLQDIHPEASISDAEIAKMIRSA
jgi:predicted small metal-binding protein